MASNYGLNFGFRRSDETMAVAEGRFKTPASGSPLLLGTAVEVDPSSAGYVKQSASGTKPVPGYRGLLVQEDAFIFGIYEKQWKDTSDLGVATLNGRCIIYAGAGTKVWFANTTTQTYPDGHQVAGVTMVTSLDSLSVGNYLTWTGSAWAASTMTNATVNTTSGADSTTDAVVPTDWWMVVTAVDSTNHIVEAVLL